MFNHKDIEKRSIFVINCLDGKALRVQSGELLLEETSEDGERKTLTKLPFQKILALFVIGHATITTPLIEYCTKYGISLVVTKTTLRPVFFFSTTAEANYLLRKKQYEYEKENLTIPKVLVSNKIQNQIRLLEKTRIKSGLVPINLEKCRILLSQLADAASYDEVMGLEGSAAKLFFSAYFEPFDWKSRRPRVKSDPLNTTLDIGYTILFNYIECFARMFGFDVYRGVYHQLWFKRKSLICDLVEPFRCLIDRQVRKAFNLRQCKAEDFDFRKGEYYLKREKNSEYNKLFFETLVEHKTEIFKYIQNYYRAFMQRKSAEQYPKFTLE